MEGTGRVGLRKPESDLVLATRRQQEDKGIWIDALLLVILHGVLRPEGRDGPEAIMDPPIERGHDLGVRLQSINDAHVLGELLLQSLSENASFSPVFRL